MATTLQEVKAKKITKEAFAKQIEKMRDRDSELVTGIFNNRENRNGGAMFNFKLYPNEEFKDYWLRDGERYMIPRGVARHLNNGCYYKEYSHMSGQQGEQGVRVGANDGRLRPIETMQTATKVHRYEFRSLEFMDDDINMYPTNLTEVTYANAP